MEVLTKTEKDDDWDDIDVLIGTIGFMLKLKIIFFSGHNEISHQTSDKLALEVAVLVDGIIYDHQMQILYDCHGQPLNPEDAEGWNITYGRWVGLFEMAMGSIETLPEFQKEEGSLSRDKG